MCPSAAVRAFARAPRPTVLFPVDHGQEALRATKPRLCDVGKPATNGPLA